LLFEFIAPLVETSVLVEPELEFFNVNEEEDIDAPVELADELFADPTETELELCWRLGYLLGKFVIVGMLRRCIR